MSLYDALEDSVVHTATLRQEQMIITVTDQAPHLPKRSYPDHFLIEWRSLDRTLLRTETVDNRFGLWNWLEPASPFDKLELPRIWRVGEEKCARLKRGGFYGQISTDLYERIQATGCSTL
jgi:hypothetical protein